MADREYYYIENEDREFLCLEDGEIGWSKFIIDAADFTSEEEADAKIIELGLVFCGVGWRSDPPQDFLYNNPEPKERRIRRDDESHLDYLHRLGLSVGIFHKD